MRLERSKTLAVPASWSIRADKDRSGTDHYRAYATTFRDKNPVSCDFLHRVPLKGYGGIRSNSSLLAYDCQLFFDRVYSLNSWEECGLSNTITHDDTVDLGV